ncbi:hypothetical protein RCG24_09730 [Neobacillus sp. OS1-32]|jgi:hypothetical protein|uniref:Uncharacterized protein n=1 Tax=Neobacillus paridis TaxID=2803862 RepID=A0ABS1TMH7_9BACI|nr:MULTISPECIES: hypothetical protein [Neobacillus]MBL4952383.1 hypothetical protein [Neobacillus paridis]WML32085.1 hypothetical protein RCG24_09730 [Neobacillus sp. OS1-32]
MDDKEINDLEEQIEPENFAGLEESNDQYDKPDRQQDVADPFTTLMFGPKRAEQLSRQFPAQQPIDLPPTKQNDIDLEALIVNIDTLIESVRGLKPLFQQVYPHIEKFWKKK